MRRLYEYGTKRTVNSIVVFVAFRGTRPVGWAWSFPNEVNERRVLFTFMYVDPDYRRQGLGSALLAHARARARAYHRPSYVDRYSSIPFFKKMGQENRAYVWDSPAMYSKHFAQGNKQRDWP